MSHECTRESDTTRQFLAATHTLRILDAYGLHRPLDSRTPNDLNREAGIALSLQNATTQPLGEDDPLHNIFQTLADPCMEEKRDWLIRKTAAEFIKERRLERTLAELGQTGEVLELKAA